MDISSQHDIITIKNITGKDFTFAYAKAEGGRAYTIPNGATMMFPRFLAAHAVKHMIDQVLNDTKQKTNNEVKRIELAEKIIVNEETYCQEPTPSQADLLNKQVEELNKPTDLDNILKKQAITPAVPVAVGTQPDMQPVDQPVLPPQPAPETPAPPAIKKEPKAEKFAGLKAQAKLNEAVDDQVKQEKEANKPPLTKEILKNFAVNTLKLNVDEDPKLTKAFETLPVDKLAELLKYNEQQEE
jgi:hypothetical protein